MDERVKVNLKNKSIANVKIGDSTIKVKPWLELGEAAYIVDESCFYAKQLIEENKNDATVLISALAKMNMLIVLLATNLDMDDLDANTVGAAGIFDIMSEKVLNYNMIRDAVVAGIGMIGDGLIIGQLGNIASLDDLESAQEKIENYMKDEQNSEKVKSLIEVMLANNPRLADELDNVVASGDDSNGDEK